jgi:anti-sigma regulatory factor (Ser/Thr protein kinase)/serine/threonine protein phosphatase PrpC
MHRRFWMSGQKMSTDEGAKRIRVSSEADATRTVVEANRYSRESGLSDVDAQAVSTAVSELARNILKYAGRGEILFQRAQCDTSQGVIVTARDNGPGIEDIDSAMTDHFSSSGTLGLGLPGVRRMMDEFTLDSIPGESTVVCCLKWNRVPRGSRCFLKGTRPGQCRDSSGDCDQALALDVSSYSRPCRGEYVNGDLAMIERRDHLLMLAVIDGLGHGVEANAVSTRARDFLKSRWSEDVVGTMRLLHEALRGSLGAVGGIAVLNTHSGEVRFAGIGNIAYRLFGPRATRLISMAGNLGHQIRSPRVQHHQLGEEDVAVMYSDGIKDRFDQEDYPQLRYQGAETIARTVVQRFGKPHDDATCIALRIKS